MTEPANFRGLLFRPLTLGTLQTGAVADALCNAGIGFRFLYGSLAGLGISLHWFRRNLLELDCKGFSPLARPAKLPPLVKYLCPAFIFHGSLKNEEHAAHLFVF